MIRPPGPSGLGSGLGNAMFFIASSPFWHLLGPSGLGGLGNFSNQ